MSKKNLLIISFVVVVILLGCLIVFLCIDREAPIDNSNFTLVDDMKIEIYDDVNVSSKIQNIDGTLLEDKKIKTDTLGKQTIEFLYKNEKGKKRKGSIEVEIVDTTAPLIMLGNSYTVTVGYDKELTDVILSADNYDSNPVREIVGVYDMNQVGSYSLTYKVTDCSGNVEQQDFTLYVKEKSSGSSYTPTYTKFTDIVDRHKTENTKIGLDVSKWQGEIDFDKIKAVGVEFIIVRVGTGLGFHEASIEDPYFKKNIEGAKRVGIPIGIYYYSYATTPEEAKEQAVWVANLLKDYTIDLPVVFDWESWSYFNGLSLSLHGINEVADAFLNEVEKAGYTGMLYGSKYYLQNIWDSTYPVWLAHYTKETNYEGPYTIWQLCDNGKVDGINGAVDIDVMYK